MGFHGLFLLIFREHYRCGITNAYSNANSCTEPDSYTNTNGDSHAKPDANSHRNANSHSGTWDRSHQSHYFRSTGKPQL